MRCLLAAILFSPGALLADDGILPDGKRLNGALRFRDGRLHFLSGKQELRLDQLHQVRFSSAESPPARAAALHCVTLRDGQHLTGELLGLDADSVRLAPAWSDRPLTVPRARVQSIAHIPGLATQVVEDFETEPKGWKLTGAPSVSAAERASGKKSLLLDRPGQTAEFVLATPIAAGRLGINFLDPGPTAGVRWLVEADFGDKTLEVTVAGPGERYAVNGLTGGTTADCPRKPGWHRLTVDFAAASAAVLIDQHVLWDSPERGPSGPLRALRLKCVPINNGKADKVYFDDCGIARTLPALSQPDGDASQDEVWLLSGDQLFGAVPRAGRQVIELDGRPGKRTLPWSDVRGIYLRDAAAAPVSSTGEHVRLWLHSGNGSHLDRLDGVVKALDDKRLTLSTAGGEVVIDRNRLRQLQGQHQGQLIEIDNGIHHLGREWQPSFTRPKPDGLSLRKTFILEAAPAATDLVVTVAHLPGPGDGPKIAQTLAKGGGRTEVLVNGKVIDYLNRLVESSSAEPRSVRVRVPRESLKAGENSVELRLTLDRDTGRYADCLICGLTLAVPAAVK